MPSSDNGTQDWLSFVIRCEEKTPALRQECCEAKSSVPGASQDDQSLISLIALIGS
jgi:hypothetical protein